MMQTEEVKEYFKKPGTVATWWNPTEDEYAYLFDRQLSILKEWVGSNSLGKCLEVSCGKGRATKELYPYSSDYTATDISSEMLSHARSYCPEVRYQQQDAENLDVESNSMDSVICLESLVHYPNYKEAIKEFFRVLVPGGKLCIDSDNKYSLRRMVKKGYQIYERSKKQFGEDIFQPYSKRELIHTLHESGFSIERIKYLGVVSPLTVRTKNHGRLTIFGDKFCQMLDIVRLDEVPYVNRLATYHLIMARK